MMTSTDDESCIGLATRVEANDFAPSTTDDLRLFELAEVATGQIDANLNGTTPSSPAAWGSSSTARG